MARTSDRDHVVSFLATGSHSNRALALGLSAILVCMAGGFIYLLLQFKNVATTSANRIQSATSRSLLLLSSYQQAVDAFYLANTVFEKKSNEAALRQFYVQKVDSCRTLRDQYSSVFDTGSVASDSLRSALHSFFTETDSLFSCTNLIFDARVLSSGKLNIPRYATVLFERGAHDFFGQLRQTRDAAIAYEMKIDLDEVRRASDSTTRAAWRWFLVSGFLFVFAAGLSVFVIILTSRANSLMRQIKAVIAHSSNPIEITDSTGRVLYVNAEYEKWTRRSANSIVGNVGLANVGLAQISDGESARELILRALDKGETWSGEVEVPHLDGATSSASLIVFPVLDQKGKLQEAFHVFHDTTEKKHLTRKLVETQAQYRNLIESSRDAIVVVQNHQLVFVNPAAVRIFGYQSEREMFGMPFLDTIGPSSRTFLQLDYDHRPPGGEILQKCELKGVTKFGTLIDLELDAQVILWNDEKAMHASFRDISARKALERQQAIWLWEQETLRNIDRQLLGIVDLQRVLDVILQQVMILTRSHFVGLALVDMTSHLGHWRAAMGNLSALPGSVFAVPPEMVSALDKQDHFILEDCKSANHYSMPHLPGLEGEGIDSVALFPLIVKGEPRGMMVVGFRQPHTFAEKEMRVLLSVRERVSIALASGELYENLLKREKELEVLSGARVQAQEDERRRISREIHDGLGQLLTAIKLNLEMLEDDVQGQEDSGKRIVEVKQLLDNVLQEAREISYNLMPSVLDDFGLGPGLQSLCEQFSKSTGLKISFHEHGLKDRLAPDVEIGLYRIVQEALNNVAKHAEAKEASVQIVRHEGKLQLTVEDDGKGMDGGTPLRRPTTSGGTGLVSMRERAASFDGTFFIESSPGKGTVISVQIPVTGD